MGFKRPLVRIQSLGPRNLQTVARQWFAGFSCIFPGAWTGHGALVGRTKTRDLGYEAILILGDPEYYDRFGFVPAERYGAGTSRGVYIISLQALELRPAQPGTVSVDHPADEAESAQRSDLYGAGSL